MHPDFCFGVHGLFFIENKWYVARANRTHHIPNHFSDIL